MYHITTYLTPVPTSVAKIVKVILKNGSCGGGRKGSGVSVTVVIVGAVLSGP